jgi:sugar lactone lactonase YvrE
MKFRRLVGAALAAATVSAVMAATPVNAAVGDINLIAGNGSNGYSGDGGPAASAQLYYPYDLEVDSAGNLYIADTSNNVIRKIAAGTGIITTIVGTGSGGYSGDGGQADAATLNSPSSVSLDSSGNLYIADYSNHVVRKVTVATGIITTIAGNGTDGYSGDIGPATSAQLKGPNDVIVGADGALYIADYSGHNVRRVYEGVISTVAGTGTAGFSGDGLIGAIAELYNPSYLALDSSGNLYIADYSNNRVRKVAASTGAISTIAGTGTRGFSGSGGPALSAELGGPYGLALYKNTLYIGDYYNHAIWTMTLAQTPVLPPTGAGTDTMVWLATALFTAGAVLVATRRRLAR